MNTSRIPVYDRSNPDGMLIWFAAMSQRGLLFHPEDSPANVIDIASGASLFTESECMEVSGIMDDMYCEHGDGVIEACYPVFMRAAGQMAALDS